MILVDTLLYKIDQRLNKLSTNDHQQIQIEDKILALNEAQIKLIKQKVSGTVTNTGLGLDSYKKRYEDLQSLIVGFDKYKLELTDKKLNQWSLNLEKLTPKYLYYVNSYILADKDRCKDKIIWINKDLSKHGDISLLLDNEHYKPSFEYEETFNMISNNQLHVYTDGTFEPTSLSIMYIKVPAYINKEGYIMIDGEESITTNCELDNTLEDELLDLTVQNLAMYTENASSVQNTNYRIQTNE